ncbi:MAG: SRPBCC domain-containing protein [Flavobacteriales bacterium]
MKNIRVDVKDNIANSIEQIYNSIVDSTKLCGYFTTKASGNLEEGKIITWEFENNYKTDINEIKLVQNKQINFTWGTTGSTTNVEIVLTLVNETLTKIEITESSYPFDEKGVRTALGQTQGWTDFICSLKAYLYANINLRKGR